MDKRVLMKDLAAAAGVSVSQVSRALNQKPDVSPELRETVHRLAREMNYRNCAAGRRPTVALLVRYIGEFSSNLLNELIRQGEARNWRTIVVPAGQLDFLNDRLFDGAVSIAAGDFSRDWHERFGIPLVMLNSYGWLLDRVCAVFPDSNGESRLAMEHLIGLGHSRIGRLRIVSDNASEKELNRGYDEFLRVADEYGIRNRVCYCHDAGPAVDPDVAGDLGVGVDDLGDVAEPDLLAVLPGGDDGVADLLDRSEGAGGADADFETVFAQVSGRGGDIGVAQDGEHVFQRGIQHARLVHVEQYLNFALEAAADADRGDAVDAFEPVLNLVFDQLPGVEQIEAGGDADPHDADRRFRGAPSGSRCRIRTRRN